MNGTMTVNIIITICALLIFAYIFDITSSKTKMPSVILLLILGWLVRQGVNLFEFSIPDLSPLLPALGTICLILIVLEGSLELELNQSKYTIIGKTSIIALLPMLFMSFCLAYVFQYVEGTTFKIGLINAVPYTIISSAIAIPTAKYLIASNKEYITYESSLSDIFGVIFFNFITLNDNICTQSVGHFLLQLLIILIISIGCVLLLAFLLSKIKHHVKFVPIILLIILIYAILKTYHLPALIFILFFGLFIGNLDELKRFKYIDKLHPEILNNEVNKFKELTAEMTFLIRSLFFLFFGYSIETSELLNTDTLIWSIAITVGIFVLRATFLKLFKLPANPLLFIAPRGLITILLFMSIPLNHSLKIANKSLIIQVIISTGFIMMYGLIKTKKVEPKIVENESNRSI